MANLKARKNQEDYMKKAIKLVFVTILSFIVMVFVGTSVVCLANPITNSDGLTTSLEIYEQSLYDFHDEISYTLLYNRQGGYSITHIESGVICEYSEVGKNPFASLKEPFYYGGPGAYLSKHNGNFYNSRGEVQNLNQSSMDKLDEINETFVREGQTYANRESFTLITNHLYAYSYTFDIDPSLQGNALNSWLDGYNNYCGRIAAVHLLRFYDLYFPETHIPTNYPYDNTLFGILDVQVTNQTLALCTTLRNGLRTYYANYVPYTSAEVTYTILNPRNKIINHISQNKPSILVTYNTNNVEPINTSSTYGLNSAHCSIVYGYSTNYYRVNLCFLNGTPESNNCNIHKQYVYGAVFIN